MFVEHRLSTRHWVYDLETEQITLHFLGVPTKYVLLLQGKWTTLSHHSQATQCDTNYVNSLKGNNTLAQVFSERSGRPLVSSHFSSLFKFSVKDHVFDS